MAFGNIGYGRGDDYESPVVEKTPVVPLERNKGNLLAYVGSSTRKEHYNKSGKTELIQIIDDDLLCYNQFGDFPTALL